MSNSPHIKKIYDSERISSVGDMMALSSHATVKLAALVLLFLITMTPAIACTPLQFRNLNSTTVWQGDGGSGYDVFDATQIVQAITFDIRKSGPGGCDYLVAISVGGNGSFARQLSGGTHTLDYNLYSSASRTNLIKDLPTATLSELISGSFTGSGPAYHSHTVYFYLAPQQVVSPALYTDSVQFKVYEGDLSSNSLSKSKTVSLQAQVNQIAQLSLVDTNEPFDVLDSLQTLNFGDLEKDKTAAFDLRVRSNSGYDVTFQSENAGALKIDLPGDPSVVSYSIRLDGSTIDLSGGNATNVASSTGITATDGDRLPAIVTIGTVGNATAGNYSDNIAVVVTAK